jgi:hypothetical protein
MTAPYEGSEFSGGSLTGPLLSMADTGALGLVLAAVCSFVLRRVGAGLGIASSLLCLPLYLFFLAPLPVAHILAPRGEFLVQPTPGLHLNAWLVSTLLATGVTALICVRGVIPRGMKPVSQPA